ncbi:hypothetical protein M885DRAFT_150932 [Pelagophyceae sp. CCMP2097]|nr:hypothetical protein M885DRAFT_150932 [Pelagophyceae sp. CCMP2097]
MGSRSRGDRSCLFGDGAGSASGVWDRAPGADEENCCCTLSRRSCVFWNLSVCVSGQYLSCAASYAGIPSLRDRFILPVALSDGHSRSHRVTGVFRVRQKNSARMCIAPGLPGRSGRVVTRTLRTPNVDGPCVSESPGSTRDLFGRRPPRWRAPRRHHFSDSDE